MVLACADPGRGAGPGEIVLSEYSAGLDWLERNVALNRAVFHCAVRVAECDWRWFGSEATPEDAAKAAQLVGGGGWDLVIGSDLVYNDDGVIGLPRCISALADVCPCILYAHTLHRFDNCDVDFFANLHRNGLFYRELVVCEVATGSSRETSGGRASSPPPFSELFPEQRQAIFRISRYPALLDGRPEDRHRAALRDGER
jgi:hypothetical protein